MAQRVSRDINLQVSIMHVTPSILVIHYLILSHRARSRERTIIRLTMNVILTSTLI
jgi:hypothetical protein